MSLDVQFLLTYTTVECINVMTMGHVTFTNPANATTIQYQQDIKLLDILEYMPYYYLQFINTYKHCRYE